MYRIRDSELESTPGWAKRLRSTSDEYELLKKWSLLFLYFEMLVGERCCFAPA